MLFIFFSIFYRTSQSEDLADTHGDCGKMRSGIVMLKSDDRQLSPLDLYMIFKTVKLLAIKISGHCHFKAIIHAILLLQRHHFLTVIIKLNDGLSLIHI